MTTANKNLRWMFKAVIALVSLLVAWSLLLPAGALANNDGSDDLMRVNDFTSSIDEDKASDLSKKLKAEERNLKFDFNVYITDKDYSASDLAKNFYEKNDCGYGSDDDGIILCINTKSSDAAVFVDGLGSVVFSDKYIAKLESAAKEDLSKSCYDATFNFCTKAVRKVAKYRGVNVDEDWPALESESSSSSQSSASSSSAAVEHTTDELSWYPKDPTSFKDFHNDSAPRVIDNADILTDGEEAELNAHIADMRDRLGIDFVFYSDVSSYGLSRGLYAADFYQFNGYGTGDDYSGVIYFVCMEKGNRGFWTAARGGARGLLTEDNVNKLDDLTYDKFVAGKYGDAVLTQFDNLDALYTQGELPVDYSPAAGAGFLGVIASAVFGFFGLRRDKKAMKTISKATSAKMYVADGPTYSVKRDENLGTTVTRTKIVHDDDSGGSSGGGSSYSSSYSSSGGASFSGGGRSF